MKLFAIFGDPVSHSRSPLMHNSVFKSCYYPACYTRIHLKDGNALRELFLATQLSGANITVPHKEAAFAACDEIRGFAKEVGVVNTIVKEGDKLIGYNTDADGFIYAIEPFGPIKKVLVLGAGGTAKALAARFLQEKMEVTILNRSAKRLESFAALPCKKETWESFEADTSYDLVVNTTSAGLNDNNLPAPLSIVESVLQRTHYAADAIYGKMTPFLEAAKRHNIAYKDGADMLLGQGVLANILFTQEHLSKEAVEAAMKKSFLL